MYRRYSGPLLPDKKKTATDTSLQLLETMDKMIAAVDQEVRHKNRTANAVCFTCATDLCRSFPAGTADRSVPGTPDTHHLFLPYFIGSNRNILGRPPVKIGGTVRTLYRTGAPRQRCGPSRSRNGAARKLYTSMRLRPIDASWRRPIVPSRRRRNISAGALMVASFRWPPNTRPVSSAKVAWMCR